MLKNIYENKEYDDATDCEKIGNVLMGVYDLFPYARYNKQTLQKSNKRALSKGSPASFQVLFSPVHSQCSLMNKQ